MTVRRALFAAAVFLASSLLFLVEPMAGKRLLPLLGGSASVWTACLVFFQAALLLGYLCAHGATRWLRPSGQAAAYALLLAGGIAIAWLGATWRFTASTQHPIASAFCLLSGAIGLPFVALAATGPLLQAWYARGVLAPRGSGDSTPP